MKPLLKILYPLLFVFFSCSKEAIKNSYTAGLDKPNEVSELKEINLTDQPDKLNASELLAFIENISNGYHNSRKIGDMNYELQYKPHDYIVALENINERITEKEKQERIEEIKDLDYFTFKLKAENFNQELLRYKLEKADNYYSRLQYFMTDMQNSIYVKCGNDSLPCVLYHFERTFGIAPYATFSIGFERKENNNTDRIFVFEDEIFGGGTIKIRLSNKIFNDHPKLNTDQ